MAQAAVAAASTVQLIAISADGSHKPQPFRMRWNQPLARLSKSYAAFRGFGVEAGASLTMWVEGRGYIDPTATAEACDFADGQYVHFSTDPKPETLIGVAADENLVNSCNQIGSNAVATDDNPIKGDDQSGSPDNCNEHGSHGTTSSANGDGEIDHNKCNIERIDADVAMLPKDGGDMDEEQQSEDSEGEDQENRPRRHLIKTLSSSQCKIFRKKPTPPVFAYINKNRAAIQEYPDVNCNADITKKGAELFNALPEQEKETWQNEYEEQKKAYDAWAASEEGKAAIMQAKEQQAIKKQKKLEPNKDSTKQIVASGPAKGWKVTLWLKQLAKCKSRFNNAICWNIVSPLADTFENFESLARVVDADVYMQLCKEVKPCLLRKIWTLRPIPESLAPKRTKPAASKPVDDAIPLYQTMRRDRDCAGETPCKKMKLDVNSPLKQMEQQTSVIHPQQNVGFKKSADFMQNCWNCSCEAHLKRHPRCVFNENMQPFVVHLRDCMSVGRADTCDVVLDSKLTPAMISRTHAVIQRDNGYFTLADQRSTNGVLVNGENINGKFLLRNGDIITFGIPTQKPEFDYIFQVRPA